MLRGDHTNALKLTIQHKAEIDLALERIGDFDVDTLNRLAFGAGLDGDETLAEQIARRLLDLVIGPAKTHAARLAACAGVDLRFHHPVRAAQFGGGVNRLIRTERHRAGRHSHAVARQKFLGLVLVDVHRKPP